MRVRRRGSGIFVAALAAVALAAPAGAEAADREESSTCAPESF